MFYCEECRKERDWPESIAKSHGPCELCHKTAACHDMPSKYLPKSPQVIKEEQEYDEWSCAVAHSLLQMYREKQKPEKYLVALLMQDIKDKGIDKENLADYFEYILETDDGIVMGEDGKPRLVKFEAR
jgi:hypothetical protein